MAQRAMMKPLLAPLTTLLAFARRANALVANPFAPGALQVDGATLKDDGTTQWTLALDMTIDVELLPKAGLPLPPSDTLPSGFEDARVVCAPNYEGGKYLLSRDFDYVLPAAVRAETKLNHMGINWQPCGHPPFADWGQPHFDIHFYYTTLGYLDGLTCTPPLLNPLPPVCKPGNRGFYQGERGLTKDLLPGWRVFTDSAVPHSGIHYGGPEGERGNWFSPSGEAVPTWIVGGNDARLGFVETMVPLNWIVKQTSYTQDVYVAPSQRSLVQLPFWYKVTSTLVSGSIYKLTVELAGSRATGASARKDPHLHFAHGGRADFRGVPGGVFNFLSARNISLNVRTDAADFRWSKRLVHGTKLGAAYWQIRTTAGATVLIQLDADTTALATLWVGSSPGPHATSHPRATSRRAAEAPHDESKRWEKKLLHPGDAWRLHNVHVTIPKGHERALLVTVDGRWEMRAAIAAYPFASLNPKNATLLDVSARPLYDADHDEVAPHGLIGQSFDGDDLIVDGKLDGRSGDEMSTSAQAEGAIEGTYADYRLPVGSPFSTAFKYSRFDLLRASPREVHKLTGAKRQRPAAASKIVEASADSAEA